LKRSDLIEAPGEPRANGSPRAAAAISASGVSKVFRLPHERYTTVRERVVHPFTRQPYDALPALRDVSFEVAAGEFFGIVGKNGGGKSTLLKCLSGIYRPEAGEVRVEGRLAPFIELGVGFNEEMTGRDNAILNGILLGLTAREARDRLEEIIAFAELEDFVELKLKNYSSGMSVRLAFSVMIHVDADVLLFDEVLAVGDGAFQRKCLDHFARLKQEGRTVVLVTHGMESVRQFCDRAMLLHRGEVAALGDAETIASAYEELNADPHARFTAPRAASPDDAARPASQPSRDGAAARRLHRTGRNFVAFGGDLRRLAALTRALAVAEFRLRYLDSALSYLWAVMRPLAYFGVLYVFVTKIAGLDNGIRDYPVYLLLSLMLWTYFDQGTQASVQSLVHRGALLRRIPVPHVAIPLSVVLTAFFDLCMNLLAVLVVLLAFGLTPRPEWAELPVLVALLSVLLAGACFLLSALYVRFRDVDQIWIVVSQALFFGTPIFYVAASLPEGLKHVFLANPLAAIFTQARHAVVDPSAPSAAEAMGGAAYLLIPFGILVAVLALGLWVFTRMSASAAESL
jgi:ABC-type polysaccharide/polyol phosphate transport system ATPase subunit/ABC-type polysaccharide/polyol phosphate export permease